VSCLRSRVYDRLPALLLTLCGGYLLFWFCIVLRSGIDMAREVKRASGQRHQARLGPGPSPNSDHTPSADVEQKHATGAGGVPAASDGSADARSLVGARPRFSRAQELSVFRWPGLAHRHVGHNGDGNDDDDDDDDDVDTPTVAPGTSTAASARSAHFAARRALGSVAGESPQVWLENPLMATPRLPGVTVRK
jgi:hypothetical protein